MTPRDNDDARSDQPVDRPEAHSVEDEAAEPTVTRLSRADVRRYGQSVARPSAGHPQPAQPPAEGEAGEWHEVSGEPGASGSATPGRHPEGPSTGSASGPQSEPTPAREPREDVDLRSRRGRGAGRRRPGADAAAGPGDQPGPTGAGSDEQPTRPLRRPEASEEAPTVVSRGPLVGEARDSTATARDGSTRVMGGGPESRGRSGAAPGTAGATAAAGAAAAAAAGRPADSGERDEQDALRAERRAEREARDRALGKRRPQPVPLAPVEPPSTKLSRTTDRFPGSLGLFLLRLGVAAVLGIRGAQQLMDIPGTMEQFVGTALPYPEIFAWATAVASVLIAVALVLGLAVRVAGAGAALIGIGVLVFVHWWRSPFEPGLAGFRGESELLVAVAGVLLLLVGGGAWGIDAAIRKGRLQRRAEKFESEQI